MGDVNVRLPGPALGKNKKKQKTLKCHIWLLVGQAIGINPTIILDFSLHPPFSSGAPGVCVD